MTSAPPADPAPDAAAARRCPRCGTDLHPDQDWCLSCGVAATTHIAAAPTWRGPLVAMLGVLLIALAALVIAFFALADDDDGSGTATPAGQPPVEQPAPEEQIPPAEQAPADEPTAGSGDVVDDASGGTGGESPAGESLATWAEGESAWTIILSRTSSQSAAERRAQRFSEGGVPAGVLNTDDVPSLEPGGWIVFSGQYANARQAARAQQELGSAVPSSAYVRELAPG